MTLTLTPELRAEARTLIERLAVILAEPVEAPPPPPPQEPAPAPTPHVPATLTPQDMADAAAELSCDPATIRTVCAVESNGHGFAPDGRVIVLYEPHVFSRLTAHRYDSSHGGVSYPKWGTKPYPPTQDARWAQLLYAANLDHDAAYQSASYGLFQLMGFNYAACGFATVSDFVAAMALSEREHLMAFVSFVLANHLAPALRDHDWAAFAGRYNGPGQVPVYSAKLAAAYARTTQPA